MAVTAEWLVESIDGLTSSGLISKEFVGIILLPIAGNAAGTNSFQFTGDLDRKFKGLPIHLVQVTDVTVLSVQDKLNDTLQIVVGTTIVIILYYL